MVTFKILMLIVSLAGEPIGATEGPSAAKFDSMDACVQAMPSEISKATASIKENGVADKIKVGIAMCFSSDKKQHSEPVEPDKTKMETPANRGEKDI